MKQYGMRSSVRASLALGLLAGLWAAWAVRAEEPTASTGGVTMVSSAGAWRNYHVFRSPRLSEAGAKALGIDPQDLAARTKKGCRAYEQNNMQRAVQTGFETQPPRAWQGADFDDSAWLPGGGVDYGPNYDALIYSAFSQDVFNYAISQGSVPFEIGAIYRRAHFTVKDPAQVKKLSLSLLYRGGFVAYLNGKEVARASMPAGEITPDTAAEDYPLEAYGVQINEKKWDALHWFTHSPFGSYPKPQFVKNWNLRVRAFGTTEIDRSFLKPGDNILAIEFHQTDFPAECQTMKMGLGFNPLGAGVVVLKAETPANNAASNVARPSGLCVWDVPAWDSVLETSCGVQRDPAKPVRVAGVRNGIFYAKLGIASTAAIEGLSAEPGPLAGPAGTLAKGAVSVKYGVLNPLHMERAFNGVQGYAGARMDMLLDAPPAKVDPHVPVALTHMGEMWRKYVRQLHGLPEAMTPLASASVWVGIRVPKDAKPGVYRGTVAVKAQGSPALTVPLEISVTDWTLPDMKDNGGLLMIYQSPETLARRYKVELWSEPHWKLIDKSLQLMGEAGNMGLIMTMLSKSCMGESESWVVWDKQPDGSFRYDFTVFDRYLETALKYHDPSRLKMMVINAWGLEIHDWQHHKTRLGATVTMREGQGPKTDYEIPYLYGSPECEAFWKPLFVEVKKRLEKKGLGDRMMIGISCDVGPEPDSIAMFHNILPDMPWHRESHMNADGYSYDPSDRKKVVPVGFTSLVWGGGIPDPHQKRLYGWQYNPKHLMLSFNRFGTECLCLNWYPSPWSFHMWMEATLASGRNGNGRVGGDYFNLGIQLWPGAGSEAGGGSGGTVFGSYPKSQVGQVGLGNNTTDLFAPGPDGAVTTERFENARMGDQEAEARLAVEKAILKGTFPAALKEQCQALLDWRTNGLRMWAIGASHVAPMGWEESTRTLFEYAAQAAKATAP